jgi:hypothetical protein
MMLRKGQTSLEMIISIMFVLFILVIISLFANERNGEAERIKLKIDAKRVASSLADNINNIAIQGPGFYRYFSLPDTLYGITEYNLSTYQDFLEISAADYVWSTQTVSSNITTYCMDKGPFKRNKVYNDADRINIICNKPELIYINGSMWPQTAYINQSVNLSVKIMNFGPVDAGALWVRYNGTTIKRIDGIRSEETLEVPPFSFNTTATPGSIQINISIDWNNTVEESIESNNNFTISLNVIQRS